MRRYLLPAVVLLGLLLAVVGTATAHAPHRLPAVALGCVLVWRVEIGAIVFASLYGVVVVVRLALHGETLTRVGRDGIEIPRVGAVPGDRAAHETLAVQVRELERLAAGFGRAADSNPTDARLRHDHEAT
ncbi:MAG TPA: hypothetical protein VFU94_13970 [Conexibacter sp.]|nr:hypothetical protein [Conexibacter sp.]